MIYFHPLSKIVFVKKVCIYDDFDLIGLPSIVMKNFHFLNYRKDTIFA